MLDLVNRTKQLPGNVALDRPARALETVNDIVIVPAAGAYLGHLWIGQLGGHGMFDVF